MTEDTEQKLWNMPAIKKQTEVRGDNGEEEERLRLDWGDDEEAAHEGSGVYKKGKQLTKKEANKQLADQRKRQFAAVLQTVE